MNSKLNYSCISLAILLLVPVSGAVAQFRGGNCPINKVQDAGALTNDAGGEPRLNGAIAHAAADARGVWQAVKPSGTSSRQLKINFCVRATAVNLGQTPLNAGAQVSLAGTGVSAIPGLAKVLAAPLVGPKKSVQLGEAWCAFGVPGASPPQLSVKLLPASGQALDPANPQCSVRFDPALPETANLERALGLPNTVLSRPAQQQ